MIQIIGIMIGAYIITRMMDLIMDSSKGLTIGIIAALTGILTLVCIALLIITGIRSPSPY